VDSSTGRGAQCYNRRMAAGTLFIIGTPIGNLEDVTLRALRTLKECDVVFCEDTRVTRKLLTRHGIHKPTASFHQYSGTNVVEDVRKALRDGKNVAYVTDAGMPGVADPGPQLVAMCLEEGLAVDVIPGPSALATALAHLPVQPPAFTFMAFPGQGAAKLKRFAGAIAAEGKPAVVFVGPHDLAALVQAARKALPERTMALMCRELTKLHQEVKYLTLAELEARAAGEVKGEITLIFVPPKVEDAPLQVESPLAEAAEKLAELGFSGRDRVRILNALYPKRKAEVRRAVYNTGD
jgi:16S rRNA (cytidine1402-2'-O)-methyltransferase